MFLWTKISPWLDPVITDSGTRESEQPIQRTYNYIFRIANHLNYATDAHEGFLTLSLLSVVSRIAGLNVLSPLSIVRQQALKNFESMGSHVDSRKRCNNE
jgi:hypothetical protein